MSKFIVVYRTINTEIWEVEAENTQEAEIMLDEQGHMVCAPLYEEQVEVSRSGKFVYPKGQFPAFREIA